MRFYLKMHYCTYELKSHCRTSSKFCLIKADLYVTEARNTLFKYSLGRRYHSQSSKIVFKTKLGNTGVTPLEKA
jgi:hypothetical protein